MTDNRKQCWLMEGCPSRTGVCCSCVPDGDDCPIWGWFKKQIVVHCKDCKHWLPMNRFHQDYHPGRGECELNCWVRDSDWFCADGERRTDDD